MVAQGKIVKAIHPKGKQIGDEWTLNDFHNRKFIESGGTSKIYSAEENSSDTQVALKCISCHYSNEVDLVNEVEFTQHLDHCNVIKYYGYFIDHKKRLWIVMPLLERDLFNEIKCGPALTSEEKRSITKQLLSSLEYIHSKGITHADIKPENISFDRKENQLVIFDFAISSSLPTVHNIHGTPPYFSPERQKYQPFDTKSDIWSAAITILFIYLNKSVYHNDEAKLFAPPKKIAQLLQEISSETDLHDLLSQMLLESQEKRLTATEALSHIFFHKLDVIPKKKRKHQEKEEEVLENQDTTYLSKKVQKTEHEPTDLLHSDTTMHSHVTTHSQVIVTASC